MRAALGASPPLTIGQAVVIAVEKSLGLIAEKSNVSIAGGPGEVNFRTDFAIERGGVP